MTEISPHVSPPPPPPSRLPLVPSPGETSFSLSRLPLVPSPERTSFSLSIPTKEQIDLGNKRLRLLREERDKPKEVVIDREDSEKKDDTVKKEDSEKKDDTVKKEDSEKKDDEWVLLDEIEAQEKDIDDTMKLHFNVVGLVIPEAPAKKSTRGMRYTRRRRSHHKELKALELKRKIAKDKLDALMNQLSKVKPEERKAKLASIMDEKKAELKANEDSLSSLMKDLTLESKRDALLELINKHKDKDSLMVKVSELMAESTPIEKMSWYQVRKYIDIAKIINDASAPGSSYPPRQDQNPYETIVKQYKSRIEILSISLWMISAPKHNTLNKETFLRLMKWFLLDSDLLIRKGISKFLRYRNTSWESGALSKETSDHLAKFYDLYTIGKSELDIVGFTSMVSCIVRPEPVESSSWNKCVNLVSASIRFCGDKFMGFFSSEEDIMKASEGKECVLGIIPTPLSAQEESVQLWMKDAIEPPFRGQELVFAITFPKPVIWDGEEGRVHNILVSGEDIVFNSHTGAKYTRLDFLNDSIRDTNNPKEAKSEKKKSEEIKSEKRKLEEEISEVDKKKEKLDKKAEVDFHVNAPSSVKKSRSLDLIPEDIKGKSWIIFLGKESSSEIILKIETVKDAKRKGKPISGVDSGYEVAELILLYSASTEQPVLLHQDPEDYEKWTYKYYYKTCSHEEYLAIKDKIGGTEIKALPKIEVDKSEFHQFDHTK